MQTNYKKLLNIIVPISLGIFFIYYSFKDIDISKFADYIYKANYLWVFLGIIFGALSHISRSYRWKYLFEPMGYKLGFKNSLLSVFAGYLINFTLPRAGDIARGSIISKYEDIPFDKTMGTIVAERLIDLLCISIIILFGLFNQYDIIYSEISNYVKPKDFKFFLITIISVIFTFLLLKRILKKSKFYILITNFLSSVSEGVLVIFKIKHKVSFILHSIFIWLMYILMFYFTSMAFEGVQHVSFFELLISFIVASLTIVFTNGGVGVYPFAVQRTMLLFEVESTVGLAFGSVMWLSQTLMIIIFGGLSLIVLPFINRSKMQ